MSQIPRTSCSPPTRSRTPSGVCADQRFSQQPTAADCSGTLIADDLVITMGHCVDSQTACRGYLYVFNYMCDTDGVLRPIAASDVYTCAERVAYSERDDYAVIRLDRPVVGHSPAPIRTGHTVLNAGGAVTRLASASDCPRRSTMAGRC